MGLFFNPRKSKEKWASVVMAAANNPRDIPVEILEHATTMHIQQHARILYESIHLVLTSKNTSTRKSRYKLAQEKYGALIKVRKYATKEQKKEINRAIDDFLIMEDKYKHPNRISDKQKRAIKDQNKQDKPVHPETIVTEKSNDKCLEQRPKRQIWPIVALFLVIIVLISAVFIMRHISVNKSGSSISVIGGADGPTAIFLAGKLGESDDDNDVSEEEMNYKCITMDEAKEIFDVNDGTGIIVDVRGTDEFAEGHIKGAINIPNEEIGTDEITDLPDKNQIIYVYCRSGNRSKQAATKLVDLGYTNIIEIGGILDWTGDIEK